MNSTAHAANGTPWHPVTRDEHCPVCDRPDRCKVAPGGDRVLCFREPSDTPTKNGAGEGWYHDLDPSEVRSRPAPRVTLHAAGRAKPSVGSIARIATECAANLTPELVAELAGELDLPAEALDALPRLGYLSDKKGGCWTLPEVGADGEIVGLNRRRRGGGKEHMHGHARGLTMPAGWRERVGPLYVCEGASDALALTHAGLAAVGRPYNSGGVELLIEVLRDLPVVREIVILGENDCSTDGEFPGRDGARSVVAKLRAALPGRIITVMMPPRKAKDARGFLTDTAREGAPWAERGVAFAAALKPDATEAPPRGAKLKVPDRPEARVEPELVCFKDVKPEKVSWLWKGYVPAGRVTLFVGRPGVGKSYLTCDLAARLSVGGDWPDGARAESAGDALLICAEDNPNDTIRPRLDAAGADVGRVFQLKAAKVTAPDDGVKFVALDLANVELIRAALDELPGCKLLVIDPVGGFIGGRTNTSRDNEVRAVIQPLADLCAEKGIALVLVLHTRKAGAEFADDTAMDSRAYVGIARVVWHLSHDRDDYDRVLMLPGKCNLGRRSKGRAYSIPDKGEDVTPRIEWEPDGLDMHANDVQAGEPGRGAQRGPKTTRRAEAGEWLRAALAGGPVAATELERLATTAGHAWRTVQSAADKLGVDKRKTGFQGASVWSLPTPPSAKPGATGTTGTTGGQTPENVAPGQSCQDSAGLAGDSAQQDDYGPEFGVDDRPEEVRGVAR